MKNLSKNEWIAIAAAVIFVSYTLFGGDIVSLFRKSSVKDNSSAAVAAPSFNNKGVIVNDIVPGRGAEAKTGQLISVHYILSLSDGTAIQNSKDFGVPFKFILGADQVIPGWEMGFAGMKVGGIRTVIIPPELAYGSNQIGPIPPNSTLVFTIELLEVADPPAQADVTPQPAQ